MIYFVLKNFRLIRPLISISVVCICIYFAIQRRCSLYRHQFLCSSVWISFPLRFLHFDTANCRSRCHTPQHNQTYITSCIILHDMPRLTNLTMPHASRNMIRLSITKLTLHHTSCNMTHLNIEPNLHWLIHHTTLYIYIVHIIWYPTQ